MVISYLMIYRVQLEENCLTIKNTLTKGGNKNVTTKEFSNLNHLYQECETGSSDENVIIK